MERLTFWGTSSPRPRWRRPRAVSCSPTCSVAASGSCDTGHRRGRGGHPEAPRRRRHGPPRDGGLVVSGRDVSLVAGGESRSALCPDGARHRHQRPDRRPGRPVVVGHLRFRPFAGESPVLGEFVTVDPDGRTTDVVGDVWTNGYASRRTAGVLRVRLPARRRARRGPGEATVRTAPRVAVTSPSGEADGMAVDESGALWVALGAGASVGRFTPDGRLDSGSRCRPGSSPACASAEATAGTSSSRRRARGDDTGAVFRTRTPLPARRSSSAPAERVDLGHLVGAELPPRGGGVGPHLLGRGRAGDDRGHLRAGRRARTWPARGGCGPARPRRR